MSGPPTWIQVYYPNSDDSKHTSAGTRVQYDIPEYPPEQALFIPVDPDYLPCRAIEVATAIAKGYAKLHTPPQVHYYATPPKTGWDLRKSFIKRGEEIYRLSRKRSWEGE